MSQCTVFITGANGAIGKALCAVFQDAGWWVIGSDLSEQQHSWVDGYVLADMIKFCRDRSYQEEVIGRIHKEISGKNLHLLINNAAVQIVAPVEQLSSDDWHTTLDVNVIAPFLLTKILFPYLKENKGSVINIASIHAQLTKPNFSAYATSKAALVGMTRSLAVELGNYVRFNAICPAAISTPMLEAGFKNSPQRIAKLADCHPSGCIGSPEDVAKTALFIAQADGMFFNGAIVGIDGGISSRLCDPT